MSSLSNKKQIALLGGAFDPVTRGHIQIAEYVLNQCQWCDEVWLMPCFSHIYNKHMASSVHRLTMCSIAAGSNNRIKTFDYEIKNSITRETCYVIQLLLEEDFSRKTYNYSMIIGQDNANTFHHWIQYDLLQKLIRFIVVPRKGITADKQVTWYLQPPHIYLTEECSIMEVSSTMVRNLVYNKEFLKAQECVHPRVFEYIMEHNLYREKSSAYFPT